MRYTAVFSVYIFRSSPNGRFVILGFPKIVCHFPLSMSESTQQSRTKITHEHPKIVRLLSTVEAASPPRPRWLPPRPRCHSRRGIGGPRGSPWTPEEPQPQVRLVDGLFPYKPFILWEAPIFRKPPDISRDHMISCYAGGHSENRQSHCFKMGDPQVTMVVEIRK